MTNHIDAPTTGIVQRILLETALSEGSSGYWDSCGPDANVMVGRANHLLDDTEYNGATIAAIRQRDINAGRFTPGGGQDLDNVKWDIEHYSHNQHVLYYAPYQQPGNWSVMHDWLIQFAGIHAILIQVLQAHNLPSNEPGVYSHFVTISGIHSIKGYLILNGDTVDGEGHNYTDRAPGLWCDVSRLMSANVAGMIVVARNAGAPYV